MPAFLAFVPPVVWRWLAIIGVGVALYAVGYVKGYLHEEHALDAYQAKVVADGAAAAEKATATKREQDKTTQEIRDAAKDDADAIHAYYAAHPVIVRSRPGGGAVPTASNCPASPDAAASQPNAPRPDTSGVTEEACALDAARINRWRDFATKNHLPID
jgi:hypothetical protein